MTRTQVEVWPNFTFGLVWTFVLWNKDFKMDSCCTYFLIAVKLMLYGLFIDEQMKDKVCVMRMSPLVVVFYVFIYHLSFKQHSGKKTQGEVSYRYIYVMMVHMLGAILPWQEPPYAKRYLYLIWQNICVVWFHLMHIRNGVLKWGNFN